MMGNPVDLNDFNYIPSIPIQVLEANCFLLRDCSKMESRVRV